jgi:hypothetical protein
LSGFLFHDRGIPVGLISYHFPASSKARENCSLGSALRQKHAAMKLRGKGNASGKFGFIKLVGIAFQNIRFQNRLSGRIVDAGMKMLNVSRNFLCKRRWRRRL